MADPNRCTFCNLPESRFVFSSEYGFVIRDAYPISPGHALVIPRRHVGSLFELPLSEQAELLALLDKARTELEGSCRPDGYNIGINDGPAAGQTVPHLHIHLIPRYRGDKADPRGGVRWLFPEKADYWTPLRDASEP